METVADREMISQAEYARRRGVSQTAVYIARKRCGIPLVGGKLDPVLADRLWDEHTSRAASMRGSAPRVPRAELVARETYDVPAPEDWRNARARRELAEARMAELDLAEKERRLIDRDAAETIMRRLASVIVEQLERLPEQISARFGTDPQHRKALRDALRDEIDRIRREVASAAMNGVQ